MVKTTRLSESEADLLAMKLRRENMVAQHKAQMEEFKFREMIKAGEKIRNYQNEYGQLWHAHTRLPQGLQGKTLRRLQELTKTLYAYRNSNPINYPRGPPLPDEMNRRSSRIR